MCTESTGTGFLMWSLQKPFHFSPTSLPGSRVFNRGGRQYQMLWGDWFLLHTMLLHKTIKKMFAKSRALPAWAWALLLYFHLFLLHNCLLPMAPILFD